MNRKNVLALIFLPSNILGGPLTIMYCNKFLRMCLFLQEVIALTSDLVQLNEVCVAVVLLAF